jgi:aspartate kinase
VLKDLVVVKFGGSSIKDAASMRACATSLTQIDHVKVVVVSATGKTTNKLEAVGSHICDEKTDLAVELFSDIISQHKSIANDLGVLSLIDENIEAISTDFNKSFVTYKKDPKERVVWQDELSSFGERLSSLIFSSFLNLSTKTKLIDARNFIITDDKFGRANPVLPIIEQKLPQYLDLSDDFTYVTQGFIGSEQNSAVCTTLGREGSDFSATLIGNVLDAKAVYICTDVPGVATIDPRLYEGAKFLSRLSYEEAELMANHGAKVLFPRTLEPAQIKGINVIVTSSKDPDKGSTIISSESSGLTCFGMSLDKDQEILTIVGANGPWVKQVSEVINSSPSIRNTKLNCWNISYERFQQLANKIHQCLWPN